MDCCKKFQKGPFKRKRRNLSNIFHKQLKVTKTDKTIPPAITMTAKKHISKGDVLTVDIC